MHIIEEEDVIDADFDNPEEPESEEEVGVDKEKKEKVCSKMLGHKLT
jgi:hypothetical protein